MLFMLSIKGPQSHFHASIVPHCRFIEWVFKMGAKAQKDVEVGLRNPSPIHAAPRDWVFKVGPYCGSGGLEIFV
jgi:hypothetical protein